MTPDAFQAALERASLPDAVVEPTADGFAVTHGEERAEVYKTRFGVTIVVRGTRLTLPVGSSVGDVARMVAKSLRPTVLTYRDVAGRKLYIVRNVLRDRPDALVLASNAPNAVELAARHFGLSTNSFAASEAIEDVEGRFATVLCDNGRLYPIESVFKALSATR